MMYDGMLEVDLRCAQCNVIVMPQQTTPVPQTLSEASRDLCKK
jgi:hypothetical protein